MAWKLRRAASAKADSDGEVTGGSVEEERPGCLGSEAAAKTARAIPSASSIHSGSLPCCSCPATPPVPLTGPRPGAPFWWQLSA